MPTTEQLTWRNTATRPKRTRRFCTACTERAAARVSPEREIQYIDILAAMVCNVLSISLSSKSFTINCLAKCPKKYSIPFILYLLAFSMATDLAMDPEYQLFVSSKCYEAAYELLVSEPLKDLTSDQLSQVLKRLGNIRNEMGVYYMNQAAAMQAEKEGKLNYIE